MMACGQHVANVGQLVLENIEHKQGTADACMCMYMHVAERDLATVFFCFYADADLQRFC